MYGDGIGTAFGCLGGIIVLFFVIIFILGIKTCNKEIVSNEPITPTIRLEVNNNQIDTLYIYKK